MHGHQFWWAGLLRFRRYCYFQKRPNFPFWPWTIVHGHQKIESIGIGSKNSCNYKLMSKACTPILVGESIPVSEILLLSKTAKFPFLTMDSMVIKKLNRLESAQKIHATINWCQKHAHQFWWASPFRFRRYCFQKRPNFPFWPWTGHQKIESIGIGSKNLCNYKLMSKACTPILVGESILVSEIMLLSKTTKFPFLTMD